MRKLIFTLLALTSTTCHAGLCNMEPKLWDCNGTVATLKSIPVGNDVLSFPLQVNIPERIKTVEITLQQSVFLSKISGPDIEEIEISGGTKKIESLCIFLNTTHETPKLEKVVIHDTIVTDFHYSQDCGTDETKVPLVPVNTKRVEVINCNYQLTLFEKSNFGPKIQF